MLTLKDYIHQIQTNQQEYDVQPAAFSVPYLTPLLSGGEEGRFAKQNAYFFFGRANSPAMQTIREHILKQAVRCNLRILVQDPGFAAYEDMALLLRPDADGRQDLMLDLLLHRRTELAEGLQKFSQADVTWWKCAALDFPQRLADRKAAGKNCAFDVLMMSVRNKDLLTKPAFAQKLAQTTGSAVIVFVETEAEEIDLLHPLRPLQTADETLENIGAEFNYVSDTSCTEELPDHSCRDMALIEIVSCAKAYSYFATHKEYHAHDGILEWYVREME